MSAEEVKASILSQAVFLQHILPSILDGVVRIASTSSPSKAFQQGLLLAEMNGYTLEKFAVAKLARWLAVLRRDYGDAEFQSMVATLRGMAGQAASGASASGGAGGAGATGSTIAGIAGAGSGGAQGVPMAAGWAGIRPGIYRHGNYDWLGEVRVEKIAEALKVRHGAELHPEWHQLALEIFHSLYLLNTELSGRVEQDEYLKALAEATKPLREDWELRSFTVLDEFTSIMATAEVLNAIYPKLEEHRGAARGHGSWPFGKPEDVAGAIAGALKRVREEAEKMKKASAIIGGLGASKVGHRLDFSAKVKLAELLSRYPVFTRTILEAVKTVRSEPGAAGGTVEFSGYKKMESYSEAVKARIVEHAYPEELFLKRLAVKELDVRRYDAGQRGRKRRYIVMIDKSGSMSGEKMEWAKAVAASLLLASDTDDVMVAFFDTGPYPEEGPFRLSENFVKTLEKVLSVGAGGGTSIDRALEYADKHAPGYTTVLVTDGEDRVTYRPRNRLVTVFIRGSNEELKKVSEKYIEARELKGRVVEQILG